MCTVVGRVEKSLLCGPASEPRMGREKEKEKCEGNFRDFYTHGSRMRIDDLSAPTGRFVARVSAFVGTGDDRLSRAPFWPAADSTLTPIFAVPSGATPPDLPPRAPTPPSEASVALSRTGRISTRTRRRTAAAAGAAQPAVDYGFRPGRVPRTSSSRLDPPPRVSRPRLPWVPPRAHLEPQHLSRRYQSRLTATERSLWVSRF